jgi:putative colanic acid biosynthesis glycosyltransferase
MRPLVSVIIATFNAEATVEMAIRSVLEQAASVELIIIDGQSSDNTLNILGKFGSEIATVISEPDNGIYDAFNKGIDRADGEWLYFLGADDKLAPGILRKIQSSLNLPNVVVYGDVQFENGHQMKSGFDRRLWLQNSVHHQGAFYHKSLFNGFRYDIRYKTIADYALNLRVFHQKLPTQHTGELIAYCQSGGASSNWQRTVSETNQIRRQVMGPGWKRRALDALLRFYYGWKRVKRAITGQNV